MGRRERLAKKRAAVMEATSSDPWSLDVCGKTLEVTNRWFLDGTLDIWDQQLLPLLAARPEYRRYLELGVCEGQSMTWMMRNTNMEAVGVDPYVDFKGRGKQEHYDCYRRRAESNLRDYIQAGRLTLEVMNSQDYLCRAIVNEVERFDVIYVDGDHTAAAAMVDMLLGWKLLNPGGLMLLDDTNRRWNQGRPGTAESTQAFLATLEDRWFSEYRIPDHVLTPKAWCIRKRKDRGWL